MAVLDVDEDIKDTAMRSPTLLKEGSYIDEPQWEGSNSTRTRMELRAASPHDY